MPILFHKKCHLFTRLPLVLLGIILFGLSPLIVGYIGGTIQEWLTHQPCTEANCFWASLGWLVFMTGFIAIALLFALIVITIIDVVHWYKHKSLKE